MKIFYPFDLHLPDELRHPKFYLRPLRVADAELDYDAVIANRASLLVYSLGRWPHDHFTLDENRADLQRHEQEHLARERFAFTVLTPDASQCLGCVYIKSTNSFLERSAVSVPAAHPLAAWVTFWLRPKCVAEDLDYELLVSLRTWFRTEWALDQVTFMANATETRRLELFHRAGLDLKYALRFSFTPIVFYLYG